MYAPDGSKIVVLSYVDDCVYWYINEDIGKLFVGTLGKRLHVNSFVYAHWFMSIRISQLIGHSLSVDQDRYATSIVAKYLDTATVKVIKKFYKTKLPYLQNNICLPEMNKLRSSLGNIIFTTELA